MKIHTEKMCAFAFAIALSVSANASVLNFSAGTPVYDANRADGNSSGYHYDAGLSSQATVGFNWSNTNYGAGAQYYSWTGLVVSNANDLSANPSSSVYGKAGEKAQYTSVSGTDGSGVSGGNYAVWYGSAMNSEWVAYPDGLSKTEDGSGYVIFNEAVNISSIQIANTLVTQNYLKNTLNGDGDYFTYEVLIYGLNESAEILDEGSPIRVTLSSAALGVSDSWITADLTSLNIENGIYGLAFMTQTSDFGSYGANSPSYFAMDNIIYASIPESSAMALIFGIAGISYMLIRKRK